MSRSFQKAASACTSKTLQQDSHQAEDWLPPEADCSVSDTYFYIIIPPCKDRVFSQDLIQDLSLSHSGPYFLQKALPDPFHPGIISSFIPPTTCSDTLAVLSLFYLLSSYP